MLTLLEKRAEDWIAQARRDGLKIPTTVRFGAGQIEQAGALAAQHARNGKALLVTGGRHARESGLTGRVLTLLKRHGVDALVFDRVPREPTVELVNEGAELARREQPGLAVSLGGGSAMDCGKAVAALAANEGLVEDYLEGIGAGRKLSAPPLPHIAIPTAAGTGAEMTKNAVIGSPRHARKISMRDDRMIPTVALIDPELTTSAPALVTAYGGMDALTQLIESCIGIKRRPETTALALEALRSLQLGLSVAYEVPGNLPARARMSLASMIGGICLANAGLAMAHGIAAGLGALYDIPHGLACGILLSHTLRYNRDACKEPLKDALAAFLNQSAPGPQTIEDGIAAIESLARWLDIPGDLKHLRLTPDDRVRLAGHSMGSSMAGNPIPMTPETVLKFLEILC